MGGGAGVDRDGRGGWEASPRAGIGGRVDRVIRPSLKDEAFLADVAAFRARGGDALGVWWLGQSGYLVHAAGKSVLFDPYLSDSLTRKYAATDKPHVRMTERVVEPGRLTGITVVTSSHAHTDHLDAETLQPLVGSNPGLTLVCPEAQRTLSRERSGLGDARILGLDVDGDGSVPSVVEVDGIRIEAVPASHEALDRDKAGRLLYLGFVVSWGGWTLYHSGDTVLYPGMAERLAGRGIDVAFLPINGRAPERRVSGNLWGREAAGLAKAIGARWAVPGHYEMFGFNTASTDEFEAESRRLGQPYRTLRAGERWEVAAGRKPVQGPAVQADDVQVIGTELAVKWRDGTETFVSLETLRRFCPCAACLGEKDIFGTVYKAPERPYGRGAFEIERWVPVGGYAVQPVWRDGHSTGIYSWEWIRRVAAAEGGVEGTKGT